MWMPAKEDGNYNKILCVYSYDKMKNINNVLSWIMLNGTSTYTVIQKSERDSCHSPFHHTPAEKAPLAQYMLGSPLLILALNVVLMTSSSQNHISWAVELGCHPREHSPASNLYGIFACDGNSSLHRSTAGRNIWPTMSRRKSAKIPPRGGYEEHIKDIEYSNKNLWWYCVYLILTKPPTIDDTIKEFPTSCILHHNRKMSWS